MKTKKIFTVIVALIIGSCSTLCNPTSEASATFATVRLGDVNGDNGISGDDALWIQRYLSGSVTASQLQLTAMDVNEDKVIDKTDIYDILYRIAAGGSTTTVYKELYTVPDNSQRTYYKHDCSSNNTSQYTQYSISSVSSTPTLFNQNDPLRSPINIGDDEIDNENIECVELIITDKNNNISHGSGIVVDDNVIATAAHCLYSSGNFMKSITVNIYDEDCSVLLDSFSADTIHIPSNYASTYDSNYDYGLIYIDDDLSEYKTDVGVMTDSFMSTGQILITSGFTYYNSNIGYARYYSAGAVELMNPFSNYRFQSAGITKGGKSGGMVYFESSSNPLPNTTVNTKSTVGIGTHRLTTNNHTRGIRLTTTVLRFLFQNSYLN